MASLMQESIGRLLPRLILPHAQEWAERAGHSFLSKILVDAQFQSLLERVGEELESRARSAGARTEKVNGNGHGFDGDDFSGNSQKNQSADEHLKRMQERLSALETQHEMQQAIFDMVRQKIRPLALALGSCIECLVGVPMCAKCGGRGKVGAYAPDTALLTEEIIKPLVTQGTPLSLQVKKDPKSARRTRGQTTNHKEHKHGSSNGQHIVGK
jgi:hypothetical protein